MRNYGEMCNIFKISKTRKSLDLGYVINVYMVCLTQVFKVNLRSFGAFPMFDNFVSQKRLVVERNRPNFPPRG